MFYNIIQFRPNIAYLIRQISFMRILNFHGVLTLRETHNKLGVINKVVCFNKSSENKAYLLDVGSAKIPVYCHMTKHGLDACGGGGWTLVMKIDGSKVLKVKCSHKFQRLSSRNSQYKGKLTV